MKIRVYVRVEDWEGDEVVLVDREERVSTYGDDEAWQETNRRLGSMMDEVGTMAAEQAMAAAEDERMRA
jgi:hypothetical protein